MGEPELEDETVFEDGSVLGNGRAVLEDAGQAPSVSDARTLGDDVDRRVASRNRRLRNDDVTLSRAPDRQRPVHSVLEQGLVVGIADEKDG